MAARNRLPAGVLLVEGKDDSAVIQSLCEYHRLPEVFAVQRKDNVERLLEGLPLELRRPGLERLGVVLDADVDTRARWASIRGILHREGYMNVPGDLGLEGAIVTAGGRPRFGAWIMPDNRTPGMLEDFVASLVPPGDFLWTYAGMAINGIPENQRRFREVERPKAHIHTWLAWQEGPGSPMGQAITKGDLRADAPLALRFVRWLGRLFVD